MTNSIIKFYQTCRKSNLTIFGGVENHKSSKILPSLRCFSSTIGNLMKVTVIGAAGKIGQSLSLMLKQSPLIDELCLHDIKPTEGIAAELNHVDTNCMVTSYTGPDSLCSALENSKITVILAACKDSDMLNVNDMWEPNAPIVRDIVDNFAKHCPKSVLAIATNPINSLIPMACEQLKKYGVYNPKTVFGITTVDIVRANTFVAKVEGFEPECVLVPVIGGHSEETIIPVLSQAKPCYDFSNDEIESITNSIRNAHSNIIKLKPKDNAPLSNAFAIARFVISLVKGLKGYLDIVECAYVPSCIYPQLKYLSTPVVLGPNGVAKNLGVPKLNEYENCLFKNAMANLICDIKKGELFVDVQDPPPCDPCDGDVASPPCPKDHCEHKCP